MTMFINRDEHTNYNEKRIHRFMKLMGIKSTIRRPRPGYRKSLAEISFQNILNRNFVANQPNEKWLTDVTEIKLHKSPKKFYLSALLDLYDRSIVGYELSQFNNNELVFKTFFKAIANNPDASPMIHSDRGYQYTSFAYQSILKKQGCKRSMSRVSRCLDNAPMEGFWGILKSELIYLSKFETEMELREGLDEYIEFYNNERYQAKLKNMTPMEYRSHA